MPHLNHMLAAQPAQLCPSLLDFGALRGAGIVKLPRDMFYGIYRYGMARSFGLYRTKGPRNKQKNPKLNNKTKTHEARHSAGLNSGQSQPISIQSAGTTCCITARYHPSTVLPSIEVTLLCHTPRSYPQWGQLAWYPTSPPGALGSAGFQGSLTRIDRYANGRVQLENVHSL